MSVSNIPKNFQKLTISGNEPRWWNASGLTDLGYFHNVGKYIFSNTSGDDGPALSVGGTDNAANDYLSVWPQIFPQADQYAKVYYSTILADLGNPTPENILTDPVLLQNYTSNFTEPAPWFANWAYEYIGPAFSSYNNTQPDRGGPLTITPSTIYAEYLCQVPQRKSAGSLLVTTAVADLVMLEALWTIFNFMITFWLQRKDPESQHCEGCLVDMKDGVELSPVIQASHTSDAAEVSSNRPSIERRQSVISESGEPLVSSQSAP